MTLSWRITRYSLFSIFEPNSPVQSSLAIIREQLGHRGIHTRWQSQVKNPIALEDPVGLDAGAHTTPLLRQLQDLRVQPLEVLALVIGAGQVIVERKPPLVPVINEKLIINYSTEIIYSIALLDRTYFLINIINWFACIELTFN